MGFFDKINNAMIVNASRQLCNRKHREKLVTVV